MRWDSFFKKSQDTFEEISPITVRPTATSITVGISKRFILFKLLQRLQRRMEDSPYLNFISNLKSYKLFGEILSGTLHEFHRDRNNLYFRNFFLEEDLYRTVKSDLLWAHKLVGERSDEVQITITKRGVVIYENYQENRFNVLLITEHSGTWIHKRIESKQTLTKADRKLEEDIGIQQLYGPIVLKKGGIWVDNKASRFGCDYNRPRDRAIYRDGSEEWIDKLWAEPLTKAEEEWLLEGYDEFYHTLSSLICSYPFNIILDGHSMKDGPGRAAISIGTQYIPQFYMPIAREMLAKLKRLGYDAALDKPFSGGNILQWMKHQFPNRFIFFIELNKRLYMSRDRKRLLKEKVGEVSKHLMTIFDLGGQE